MRLSFSTLACPDWTLDTVVARGAEFGFDGIDLRGLRAGLDVTVLPEFTAGLNATARRIADAGLQVSAISSSISICSAERADAGLEEAARTIPVARGLGCRVVRVFGGGDPAAAARDELARRGADCMARILSLDGADALVWALETHDAWMAGADCRLILDRVPSAAFGAIWDMGHTWRVAREAPAHTAAALGERLCYVHVKDAVRDPGHPQADRDGWRYVLPGTGELPLAESIGLLHARGYNGWLTLEHEKRWHPNLHEADEILPCYVRWARSLFCGMKDAAGD